MKISTLVSRIGLFIGCFVFVAMWTNWSRLILNQQASSGFDAQNLRVWEWTARQGYKPITDIFYPYGSLFYFQQTSALDQVLLLGLGALTLSYTLSILWSYRASLIHGVVSLAVFLLFLVRSFGSDTWLRYGLSIGAVIFFADLLHAKRMRDVFVFGTAIGLLFGLVQDQSVYISIVCILLMFFSWIASQRTLGRAFIIDMCIPTLAYMSGWLIGCLPFLTYLHRKHELSQFLGHTAYLRDMSLFAKTPFIPFALLSSNIFIFVVLFASLSLLSYTSIVLKRKATKLFLVIVSLSFLLLLLEQKSIVRSMDWQIAGVAFLLLLFLLSWVRKYVLMRSPVLQIVLYVGLCGGVFFYPFRQVLSEDFVSKTNKTSYESVVGYVRNASGSNGKVFSYPADPIYYELTNQTPPYFLTSYEATPLHAQEKVIEYIVNQDISYVVYNLDISAVQDGVPNYVRNAKLFSYILTHYQAEKRIDNFLLLKRANSVDMSRICTFAPEADICTWLSQADMGMIPKSQGTYSSSRVWDQKVTFVSLNEQLHAHSLLSTNQILSFETIAKDSSPALIARFTTTDKEVIKVQLAACEKCVLRLGAIPGFYQPKKIERIEIDGALVTNIAFFSSDSTNYW